MICWGSLAGAGAWMMACMADMLARGGLASWPCSFPSLPSLASQVSSDETERLIKMEEVLHGRVIGQEEAVSSGGGAASAGRGLGVDVG